MEPQISQMSADGEPPKQNLRQSVSSAVELSSPHREVTSQAPHFERKSGLAGNRFCDCPPGIVTLLQRGAFFCQLPTDRVRPAGELRCRGVSTVAPRTGREDRAQSRVSESGCLSPISTRACKAVGVGRPRRSLFACPQSPCLPVPNLHAVAFTEPPICRSSAFLYR